MSSLSPEVLQCLIGCGGLLVGYILRHLHISLPVISGIIESIFGKPAAPGTGNVPSDIWAVVKGILNAAIDEHAADHAAKQAKVAQVAAAVEAATK